jgi:hypothetical protein
MSKPSKEQPTRFKYNEGRVRLSTKGLYIMTGCVARSPIWASEMDTGSIRFKYNEGRVLFSKGKPRAGTKKCTRVKGLLMTLRVNSEMCLGLFK